MAKKTKEKNYSLAQLAAAFHVVKNWKKTQGENASSTGDVEKRSVETSFDIIYWFKSLNNSK